MAEKISNPEVKLKIAADGGKEAAADVRRVDDAVEELGREAKESRADLKDLGEQTRKVGDNARLASDGAALLARALPAIAVGALVRQFIDLNSQLESHQKALSQITGSDAEAAQEMEYLRALSDQLGQSTLDLTGQYVQLSAATQGTALEGRATRDVFEAVVGAMARLGKSSAETERALTAVAQIASKGVVSQEEMRQQLGEALPGAMQALSQATGITVTDLNTMIESGQLLAADVLPALAQGLNEVYGDATAERIDTLTASVARFQNALSRAFTETGQGGLAEAFGAIIDVGTDAMDGLVAGTVTLGKNLGALGAYVEGSIPSWDALTAAIAENNAAGQAYIDRATEVAQAGQEQSSALQAVAAAGLKSAANYGKLNEAAQAALKATGAQGEAAVKAAQAELAHAKAIGERGAVLQTQARLDQVAAEAAREKAAAAEDLARISRERIAQIEREVDAIRAQAQAEGLEAQRIDTLTAGREQAIATLSEEATLRDANAAKLREEANAQALAATQARLQALTYGDQSARLQELIAQRDELTAKQRAGVPVGDELAQVQVQIADAAKDAADGITLEIQAIGRQAAIAEKQGAVQAAELQRRQALARARGDETQARRIGLQILREEIQLTEQAVAVKRAEADALARQAQKLEISAQASGEYTAAERAQVDAIRDAAQLAELEADQLAVTVKAKRDARQAAEDLAAQERALGAAMRQVGVDGVASLEDVQRAIAAAANGGELQSLEAGLRQAFESGAISARQLEEEVGRIAQRLGQVADATQRAVRSMSVDYEQAYRSARKGVGGRAVIEDLFGTATGWARMGKGATEYRQRLIDQYREWESEFLSQRAEKRMQSEAGKEAQSSFQAAQAVIHQVNISFGQRRYAIDTVGDTDQNLLDFLDEVKKSTE